MEEDELKPSTTSTPKSLSLRGPTGKHPKSGNGGDVGSVSQTAAGALRKSRSTPKKVGSPTVKTPSPSLLTTMLDVVTTQGAVPNHHANQAEHAVNSIKLAASRPSTPATVPLGAPASSPGLKAMEVTMQPGSSSPQDLTPPPVPTSPSTQNPQSLLSLWFISPPNPGPATSNDAVPDSTPKSDSNPSLELPSSTSAPPVSSPTPAENDSSNGNAAAKGANSDTPKKKPGFFARLFGGSPLLSSGQSDEQSITDSISTPPPTRPKSQVTQGNSEVTPLELS